MIFSFRLMHFIWSIYRYSLCVSLRRVFWTMAQCGGLFILNTVDEPERYSTYFMKIDNVKFRQKVVPGDTLIFRVELLAPMRRGISSMKGYVFVGEKVVCEAEFTAQIVKNK